VAYIPGNARYKVIRDGDLPGFRVPKNKKSPDAPNGTPGVFCQLRFANVHRDIKRNKSLPAMAMSRPKPNEIPIAKQVESCIVFCNSCNPFFFCFNHFATLI
jgi:hypothetical protein